VTGVEMVMSAASLEYVRVRIDVTGDDGSAINPTTDPVAMAFTLGADPVSGDWQDASWTTDSTGTRPVYRARCLVGPGGTVLLTAGLYTVWVRITDSPEVPVLSSGYLRIT
jgi:hypothetical protein